MKSLTRNTNDLVDWIASERTKESDINALHGSHFATNVRISVEAARDAALVLEAGGWVGIGARLKASNRLIDFIIL